MSLSNVETINHAAKPGAKRQKVLALLATLGCKNPPQTLRKCILMPPFSAMFFGVFVGLPYTSLRLAATIGPLVRHHLGSAPGVLRFLPAVATFTVAAGCGVLSVSLGILAFKGMDRVMTRVKKALAE